MKKMHILEWSHVLPEQVVYLICDGGLGVKLVPLNTEHPDHINAIMEIEDLDGTMQPCGQVLIKKISIGKPFVSYKIRGTEVVVTTIADKVEVIELYD